MNSTSKKGVAKVPVLDVEGTHVKVLATGHRQEREIPPARTMTANKKGRDVK